jgi:hypothetical protein
MTQCSIKVREDQAWMKMYNFPIGDGLMDEQLVSAA